MKETTDPTQILEYAYRQATEEIVKDDEDEDEGSILIVIIIAAAVCVLIGAILLVVFLISRKKGVGEESKEPPSEDVITGDLSDYTVGADESLDSGGTIQDSYDPAEENEEGPGTGEEYESIGLETVSREEYFSEGIPEGNNIENPEVGVLEPEDTIDNNDSGLSQEPPSPERP